MGIQILTWPIFQPTQPIIIAMLWPCNVKLILISGKVKNMRCRTQHFIEQTTKHNIWNLNKVSCLWLDVKDVTSDDERKCIHHYIYSTHPPCTTPQEKMRQVQFSVFLTVLSGLYCSSLKTQNRGSMGKKKVYLGFIHRSKTNRLEFCWILNNSNVDYLYAYTHLWVLTWGMLWILKN